MTIAEAKRIYIGAGGPADHTPREWDDIQVEMEDVVRATSDRAGGRVILWWDCWDKNCTATRFARRIRELHRGGD